VDRLRRTTYFWAGWSFVLIGLLSGYPVIESTRDTTRWLGLGVCFFEVALGVLFVRRSRQFARDDGAEQPE
jgi:hypothetical protein